LQTIDCSGTRIIRKIVAGERKLVHVETAMSDFKYNRREFIALTSLALSAPSISAALGETSPTVQFLAYDDQGQPLSASGFARFHLCDSLMRPFTTPFEATSGQVRFTPPDKPFRIGMPLSVPGFGQVFVYADDGGVGYTGRSLARSAPLVLNYAFARDRIATVRKLVSECKQLGVVISPETQNRIDAAQAALTRADAQASDRTAQVRASMESLRDSLYAGEMLVITRAQHAIAHQPARPGFLFGCNGFGLAAGYPEALNQFQALFNYTTLPIYEGWVEPEKGHPDYSAFEAALNTLVGSTVLPKGHPCIWLEPENTPKWLQNISYDETKRYCLEHVRQAISRYRHRVHIWDVVNELHVQPELDRGMAGFTREQNVELTVAALKTAREADPTCFRIVNNTGTWADYYMGEHPAGSEWQHRPAPWQQSPYDYLVMLRDAKADYEAIGLQYYHSGRDLVEWERDLESFNNFGKPIHITEMGFPSSLAPYPGQGKYAFWGGGNGGEAMAWHNNFTETIQADYVESIYTIAYSKPWVEAITYWDFNGIGHDGFMRADGTPRESYHRLMGLFAKWRNQA
jgi:endo-1,4-beta-xylanase